MDKAACVDDWDNKTEVINSDNEFSLIHDSKVLCN